MPVRQSYLGHRVLLYSYTTVGVAPFVRQVRSNALPQGAWCFRVAEDPQAVLPIVGNGVAPVSPMEPLLERVLIALKIGVHDGRVWAGLACFVAQNTAGCHARYRAEFQN